MKVNWTSVIMAIVIPAIGLLGAGIGGIYLLILDLSVQMGVMQTKITFLQEDYDELRVELRQDLNGLRQDFIKLHKSHVNVEEGNKHAP